MRRYRAIGGGMPLRPSSYGRTFEQALTDFRRANPTARYCHVVEIELTSDRPIGPAIKIKFTKDQNEPALDEGTRHYPGAQ